MAVGNAAVQRRRQHAVSVAKERREATFRAKRLRREGVSLDMDVESDGAMVIEEEPSVLDAQMGYAVEELKLAVSFKGNDEVQKKVNALRELRRLLSRSEFPFVEISLKRGVIPLLGECLKYGSEDEQLLEAAWCLTNIAAGKPEETKALLPTLPLLIAHLEKSSLSVAEQCAWALGNVAAEGEELKDLLISQGALRPLGRMMLSDNGSTVRTAAWALSNLLKGQDPEAATKLLNIDGVVDAILRHLKKSDIELATEVAWVVVHLSMGSDVATSVLLMQTNLVQVLVDRLAVSSSLQSLIPLLRSLGNLMAGDAYTTNVVLVPGHEITDSIIRSLSKCLKSEHRFLKKEAAWVLSNIAAGSVAHKQLICKSEAVSLLLQLLTAAPFDIKKEVAYVLGNLCVAPADGSGRPSLLLDHLVAFVRNGCLRGFIALVRSPDLEAARLGLHFIELVLSGMPNGEGPKLVDEADGIEAIERFQFHENDDLRMMSNMLVDCYFGETYGLDE
ncbi:importin subunit alpha [Artemisia annua]|uniref:Importin subunit alpha n=1 Tax=Artemisia annua TaxID=35608 RepID=A0A2U1KS55_ARTAN|nr:importin subunit alpha [Artemisia annua]